MESILLLLRILLFGVFFIAGVGKLLDQNGAKKAAVNFGTPTELAGSIAIALPFAEIVFAFCFLFAKTSWLGSVGASILLAAFTAAMAFQMRKGNAPDCNCFGQVYSEPVSTKSLARNLVLLVMTLALVARGQSGQGPEIASSDPQTIQTIALLIVSALAIVILAYLKRLSDRQEELLNRVESVEDVARSGGSVHREHVSHPEDSLPIGSPFPDFTLTTTSGESISLQDLLSDGQPVLCFFVTPTCEPCRLLVPEIENWRKELSDKIEVVFFSSGAADENLEKFGAAGARLLLQVEREVADAVRAKWTPTALLVGRDGRIASHIAAGDIAIRKLIDGIRASNLDERASFVADRSSFYTPPRIGRRLPDFELADLDGRIVRDKEFHGRRTVAMFWSPTCPYCVSMTEALKNWESSRGGDGPAMLILTEGDLKANRALGFRSPVILDTGRKLSEKLGMWGTPSAVVLDETAMIVSETAVGEENIWALLGHRNASA